MKQNGFWIGALGSAYRLDLDPMLILEHDELVESVTTENLRQAAGRYLLTDRSVRAILYPEDGPAAGGPEQELE